MPKARCALSGWLRYLATAGDHARDVTDGQHAPKAGVPTLLHPDLTLERWLRGPVLWLPGPPVAAISRLWERAPGPPKRRPVRQGNHGSL